MSPLLIGGILLGLLLLAKGKAQASSAVTPTRSQKKVTASGSALRLVARQALSYVNTEDEEDPVVIRGYQKQLGCKQSGKPDDEMHKRIEKILNYAVSWVPGAKVAPTKLFKPVVTKPKTVTKAVPVAPPAAALAVRRATPPQDPLTLVTKPAVKPAPKPAPLPIKVSSSEEIQDMLSTFTKGSQATAQKRLETIRKPQDIFARTEPVPVTTARSAPKLPAVPTVSDAVAAAESLDDYLADGGIDRGKVKVFQARMGGLTADGVAGPRTFARAKELLGRTLALWPANKAALDLHTYYAGKGRDKVVLASYQKTMGELDADGAIGPKSKARYTALTGKAW